MKNLINFMEVFKMKYKLRNIKYQNINLFDIFNNIKKWSVRKWKTNK